MSTTFRPDELLEFVQPDREEYSGFTLGEGAIGSMIPPSIVIILFAIIRLIQLFQQRRNLLHDGAIQFEIKNESDDDVIKLEIIEESHQLTK